MERMSKYSKIFTSQVPGDDTYDRGECERGWVVLCDEYGHVDCGSGCKLGGRVVVETEVCLWSWNHRG